MLIAAEALGHLERDLKQAHEDLAYAEAQRQASQHVGNVNALRAENARQAQEIESLKTRLTAAEAKNRQTDDMIYGKLESTKKSCQAICPRKCIIRNVLLFDTMPDWPSSGVAGSDVRRHEQSSVRGA